MRYELINPSDKCFFVADTDDVAKVIGLLLGGSFYGVRDENNKCILSPFEDFDEEEFRKITDKYKIEIIVALESFYYDGERTSVNDIGASAKSLAKRLRELEGKNV